MGLSLFDAFAIKMVFKFVCFFFLLGGLGGGGEIFKLSGKIEGMDLCRKGKFLLFFGRCEFS